MFINLQNTKIYQITLGLLFGIILNQVSCGVIVIISITTALFCFKKFKFIILILFMILGYLYCSKYSLNIIRETNNLLNTKGEVNLVVTEAPLVKEFYQEALLKPQNSNILVLTKLDKYEKLNPGDLVTIISNLKIPKESTFFDRISYLKSKKIFLESEYPQIIKINQISSIDSYINSSRDLISKNLTSNLSEPETTLAKGLIVGDDNNFADDFKENLKNSGLSHITSVSGYNVAIIFAGILYLNRFINRKLLLILATTLIFFFWQLVGTYNLPTERATIMLSLATVGLLLGRRLNIFYLVLLSTLLMLLEYPYYLQNISFQLSLGAVLGILILAPRIIKILENKNFKNIITEIIAVTLAVLIFTIPISYLTFNQTSSIAILSNILVLPLIPVLTLCLVAGLGLTILNLTPLSEIIFFFANYLLKFVISIVNNMGSLSFANISDSKIALIFYLALTIPILFLIIRNKHVQ